MKYLYFTSMLILSACNNSPEPDFRDDIIECHGMRIKNGSENFPEDKLTISHVLVNNNGSVMITIQYGGGCGKVAYDLVAEPFFLESNPVQCNLFLSFKDNDPCKAIITEDICFDLTAITNLYKSQYQTSSGTIILNIKGYETPLHYSF